MGPKIPLSAPADEPKRKRDCYVISLFSPGLRVRV